MPLHLYRSNRIEHLAELLAALLKSAPPTNPFAPIRVAVGSRGMEQWLRQRLAERLGICAAMDFPFPAALVAEALDKQLGDTKDAAPEAPWGPDALAWSILERLPALYEQPDFAALRPYLGVAGAAESREYGLARQIADVFDRYATFRPELAVAWSQGSSAAPVPAHLAWQPTLWKALQEHLSDAPHRATRLARATQALAAAAPPPDSEPLRLFGLSSLPPAWIDLLAALPVDVDLFVLCPSSAYWADLRQRAKAPERWRDLLRDDLPDALAPDDAEPLDGHPLLASMGRVGRDLQLVLESQPPEAVQDAVDLFHDPADAPAPTALAWLQSDLLHARHPSLGAALPGRALAASDSSVQLHACYGATRQVEALRDTLLHLLQAHADLEPRDVLVMTPDVATFAPLVQAVFSEGRTEREPSGGWGPAGAPRLPVMIDDQRLRKQNAFADTLARALALVDERVTASSVLELLLLEPVQRRFGLDAADVPLVDAWARQAGARWGLDAADRAAHDQPRDAQNTWEFALERLALGVCMPDDDGALFAQRILPFDAIEGRSTALLGPLMELVRGLRAALRTLTHPRPLSEWAAPLHALLDQLTATGDDDAWANLQARAAIDALTEHAKHAHSRRPIALAAVRAALDSAFDRASPGSREGSGAITVCAMAPMRSVPYRVIALLGLDDGAFPRQRPSAAFDLTATAPRAGDRDPRDEDRYLLLEALLAARDHLLIFYSGHDVHTNEPVPPAVPVGELCDVLDQSFPSAAGEPPAAARLTRHHPLQAWASANFVPRERGDGEPLPPWSFSERLAFGATALRTTSPAKPLFGQPIPARPPTELSLDALARFLVNPTRGLMQRLSVQLGQVQTLTSDREPVELEPLDRWKLIDALLADRLAGRDTATTLRAAYASGQLPLGDAGQQVAAHLSQQVDGLLHLAALPPGGALRPDDAVPIRLERGGLVLTGQLTRRYGAYLRYVYPSGESAARLLPAWIELLAWCAAHPEHAPQGAILALDPKKPALIGLAPPAESADILWALVDLYLAGQSAPLPLFPRASFAFARVVVSKAGAVNAPPPHVMTEALGAADAAWSGGFATSDVQDAYVDRVWGAASPHREGDAGFNPAFVRLALTTYGPLLLARHTSSAVKKWLEAVG